MPIYRSSYFPAARSTGSVVGATSGPNVLGARDFLAGLGAGANSTADDLLIIGANAGDAGITDADLAGTIVVGNAAAGALTLTNSLDSSTARPNVIAGFNAATLAVNVGACVVIGAGALDSYVGATNTGGALQGLVAIGTDVLANINGTVGNGNPPALSVVIGHRAALGTNGSDWFLQDSTIIGALACDGTGGGLGSGAQMSANVVIGAKAARALGTGSGDFDNVIIGAQAAEGGNTIRECVIIGKGASVGNSPRRGGIAIGNGAQVGDTGGIALGQGATSNGDRAINIGQNAALASANQIYIGNADADNRSMLLADMSSGAIILGNVANAASGDRALVGTNTVKLLNGAAGATPAGGGYFYVDGSASSALHWVDSAGTDSTLSGSSGSTVLSAVKPADTSRNSTTTTDLDPDLQFTNVPAGTYAVDAYIYFVSAATPDLKLSLGASAAVTLGTYGVIVEGQSTGLTAGNSNVDNFRTAAGGNTYPADGTNDNCLIIRGTLVLGNSTTEIYVQWAQNTSDAANTTLKRGSWLRLTKLA